MYEPLNDELIAWSAIGLKGNLDILIENYKKDKYFFTDINSSIGEDNQLELGDIDEHFYPLSR